MYQQKLTWKKIWITGQMPEYFEEAFAELSGELFMEKDEKGYRVVLKKDTCLTLAMTAEEAVIGYSKRVECFRGLSLLSQYWGQEITLSQEASFPHIGVMFDVSRNAVLKPETLKYFFRKMALMGLNLGMMYTEDTYEVEEYPYFGYLRGRYSKEDLRKLDDYANLFGIELCPCIQTLAHLNRVLHWPQMAHMKDTEESLLVGSEQVYEFVYAMLKNATEPYRSNRIHIGMDEAHALGLGEYLRKCGYENPFAIMKKHLDRVAEMVRELKLDALMWSDMYFRLSSPSGGYYDSPMVEESVVAGAPEDITLVYWDYYHQTEDIYEEMFRKHAVFAAPKAFAGGIWTWTGPAPDLQHTVRTAIPGLRQARKNGVELVLAAAWGDNGAETNLLTTLYGLQLYSEFNYTGDYAEEAVKERFAATVGANPEAFLDLTLFNQLPGVKNCALRPVNAAKFLLYQDPLVPLFDADLAGVNGWEHYKELESRYAAYKEETTEFGLLFAFYEKLAHALSLKCHFHQLAGDCVRRDDRKTALFCVTLAKESAEAIEELRKIWMELWNSTNKVYGFEILDLRLGGVAARMKSAALLMEEYGRGSLAAIEPLAEEPLPYTQLPDGSLKGSYAWGEIASSCKTDI